MSHDLILLAENSIPAIRPACMCLQGEGFRVHEVGGVEAVLQLAATQHPALVILDVRLLKMNGFEVCCQLRAEQPGIGIILVTARDEEVDRVLGLEMGADDYLSAPFNPLELVARVKAILRRGQASATGTGRCVSVGDLVIVPTRREATRGGNRVELRAQEFDLLLVLAEHRGQVLTREQLLRLAWGSNYRGRTRTVDVHVAHLRKKLEGSSAQIETVAGAGYRLAG